MINLVSFEQAVELVKAGAVGVVPTDTVYGLVASALDEKAVERLYALKDREKKPGTLIASNIDDLHQIGADESETQQASALWPNPVSVVIAVAGHEYLHQGVGTLAMRVTANPTIHTFIQNTGPLITTSANQPGEPIATTITEAIDYFGDNVDFYVDGGVIADVPASTILRPIDGGMEILRQGSFTL